MILLEVGQGKVTSVGFAAGGEVLHARTPRTPVCKAWRGSSFLPIKLPRVRSRYRILVLFGDEPSCIGVDTEGWTKQFDLTTDEEHQRLFQRQFPKAHELLIGNSGEFICVSESVAWNMKAIYRWESAHSRELKPLLYLGFGPQATCLSQDCEILATGGDDRRVRLWKVREGNPWNNLTRQYGVIGTLYESFVHPFLEAVQQQMAGGKQPDHLIDEIRSPVSVKVLAFSPDQNHLLIAGGWRIFLYHFDDESQGGKLSLVIKCLSGPVRCLACSPDSRSFAVGFRKGTVEVRDLETGDLRQTYRWEIGDINSIVYSPDGLRLAAGGNKYVVVWDVE